MDGEHHGKPYEQTDDLGGTTIFGSTSVCSLPHQKQLENLSISTLGFVYPNLDMFFYGIHVFWGDQSGMQYPGMLFLSQVLGGPAKPLLKTPLHLKGGVPIASSWLIKKGVYLKHRKNNKISCMPFFWIEPYLASLSEMSCCNLVGHLKTLLSGWNSMLRSVLQLTRLSFTIFQPEIRS